MSEEYPYSIRDVHISDPFILADEKDIFRTTDDVPPLPEYPSKEEDTPVRDGGKGR